MEALKHHFAHHRLHMLGCGTGVLLMALGTLVNAPVVGIAGAAICGVFCLDMVRMMVVRPRRG
jgi:hypothetical protein